MHVFLTREAEKQYQSLPKIEKEKISKKLILLKNDPLAGKKLLGELRGLRSLKTWPYRVIYDLDQRRQEVWIVSILHRQGVYK